MYCINIDQTTLVYENIPYFFAKATHLLFANTSRWWTLLAAHFRLLSTFLRLPHCLSAMIHRPVAALPKLYTRTIYNSILPRKYKRSRPFILSPGRPRQDKTKHTHVPSGLPDGYVSKTIPDQRAQRHTVEMRMRRVGSRWLFGVPSSMMRFSVQ